MPAVWDRKHLCPRGRRNSAAKFCLVKLRLEVQLLTFRFISFERKGTPGVPYTVPLIDKWYPFQIPSLELCITFSCCKYTVFRPLINQKTRKLSRLFHSHKILLLALLGLFTEQNDTDFSTLSYFSITPEVWKRYPFRNSGGASRVGHCRGFSPCSSLNQHATKLIILLRLMLRFIYDVRGWWLVLFSFFYIRPGRMQG